MSEPAVLFEKKGNLAIVTINRPKALNSLNNEVINSLDSIVGLIEKDREIRVVIITGSGEKAFVAGADIKEMFSMNSEDAREWSMKAQYVFNRIENLNAAVIAAVNGYALGGGCELALACDFRIGSNNSKFGLPELGLGVIPGFAGTQRLPRLVGKGRAKEIIFTGRQLKADEALSIGLVNKVVDQEELMKVCINIADTIASKSKTALMYCKESVNYGMEMDLNKGIQHEADLFALTFTSEDQKEGMSAFIEKRTPNFGA
jgi:enoyl-CoA hydratase